MDLRLMDVAATEEERAAVDAVLGAPATGWEGGVRSEADGRLATGGAALRARRHLLLPALHAVQDALGWISSGALNYVCERVGVPPAEAHGVASFYALFATAPRAPRVLHVCDDIVCRSRGAIRLCAELEERFGPAGREHAQFAWERSPCLGRCDAAPAAYFQAAGGAPVEMAPVRSLDVSRVFRGEAPAPGPTRIGAAGTPRLLRRIGRADPGSIDDYRASGGYEALRRAIGMGPAEVVAVVVESQLIGRGGAGFPAGRKWAAVAAASADQKYLVCNADESEPGTFKDRVLLEGDPFAIVEAMTIAGFAVGADRAFLYIREEYPGARAALETAIAAAREHGLLGPDVAGAGFSFDVEIRRGAGAYVCGEETALFESIEGRRGEPRAKPPFPTEVGLFGKPTLVNNVETLANIPLLLTEGVAEFTSFGTVDSTGTKLFSVSGRVGAPGVYEVPFGTRLGDLLDLAGGVAGEVRTVLLGGAAGAFVGPDALDLPLSFEAARAAGVTLGSGAVVVFGPGDDVAGVVLRIARFFREESCGQCVPCRVGTVRQEEALLRLVDGSAADEAGLLADIGRVMEEASICGLGQTASTAVRSALRLGLIGNGAPS